jgi:hypothetical protein
MSDDPRNLDPLKAWRDWFIQNERAWSEELTRMMKQDAVAQAIGKEINAALYWQQMLTQGMATWLGMFNLPTRDDVLNFGERLGRLEDSVARQEVMLLEVRNSLGVAGLHAPPRTREASAAKGQHGRMATPSADREKSGSEG